VSEIRFWNLHGPNSTAKLAEWAHDEMELEQVICPADDGHRRGGKRLTDLSVTLPGGAVQDFVWTWPSECLMQDHVLELFRANGFTGFQVKSVKAEFKRATDRKPPRLWEMVVTGWGASHRLNRGSVSSSIVRHAAIPYTLAAPIRRR